MLPLRVAELPNNRIGTRVETVKCMCHVECRVDFVVWLLSVASKAYARNVDTIILKTELTLFGVTVLMNPLT